MPDDLLFLSATLINRIVGHIEPSGIIPSTGELAPSALKDYQAVLTDFTLHKDLADYPTEILSRTEPRLANPSVFSDFSIFL